MLKRSFVVMGVVACMTTGAMADALIGYDVPTDDPLTPGVYELPVGVSTPVTVTVTNTTGSWSGVGGAIFNFMAPAEATLDAWTWDPAFTTAEWFATDGLPDNVQAVFLGAPGTGPELLQDETRTLGVLEMTLTQDVMDPLNMSVGADPGLIAEDMTFLEVDIEDGSNVFTFIPEPATMVLLAVGGMTTLRRRR